MPDRIVMILKRQTELLQVVLALHAPSRFARGLHRWEQQCNQDTDDRNYHQQFDERKGHPPSRLWQERSHTGLLEQKAGTA
jgi:hypothetical protein